MSLSGIACHDAERLQAGCSSCLQRQHPGQTALHSPPPLPVCLNSFPSSTHSLMDAAFPPAPISSHSASDQQMLMVCICFENEILGKKGTLERRSFDLFSLISFSLNSPYQYFLLSAKFFKTLSRQKMQGTILCCPPPSSNESSETMSCCWSCCRQELPFGNTDPVLALACAGVAVPGSSCPPAQSPPAALHTGKILLSRSAG